MGFWGPKAGLRAARGFLQRIIRASGGRGGRFGWAVYAFLNAEKTIAARKCHLGILSEYGPFSVNTPIWPL